MQFNNLTFKNQTVKTIPVELQTPKNTSSIEYSTLCEISKSRINEIQELRDIERKTSRENAMYNHQLVAELKNQMYDYMLLLGVNIYKDYNKTNMSLHYEKMFIDIETNNKLAVRPDYDFRLNVTYDNKIFSADSINLYRAIDDIKQKVKQYKYEQTRSMMKLISNITYAVEHGLNIQNKDENEIEMLVNDIMIRQRICEIFIHGSLGLINTVSGKTIKFSHGNKLSDCGNYKVMYNYNMAPFCSIFGIEYETNDDWISYPTIIE